MPSPAVLMSNNHSESHHRKTYSSSFLPSELTALLSTPSDFEDLYPFTQTTSTTTTTTTTSTQRKRIQEDETSDTLSQQQAKRPKEETPHETTKGYYPENESGITTNDFHNPSGTVYDELNSNQTINDQIEKAIFDLESETLLLDPFFGEFQPAPLGQFPSFPSTPSFETTTSIQRNPISAALLRSTPSFRSFAPVANNINNNNSFTSMPNISYLPSFSSPMSSNTLVPSIDNIRKSASLFSESNLVHSLAPSVFPSQQARDQMLIEKELPAGEQNISEDNPNNLFKLKEPLKSQQRKSYKTENRYLLPNPIVITLKDKEKRNSISKAVVSVELVDGNGKALSEEKRSYLDSSTPSGLVQWVSKAEGTAKFFLKVLENSRVGKFRLRFLVNYATMDNEVHQEIIFSNPFIVRYGSNKTKNQK